MQRAQVIGILNATPDSFSDGGLFLSPSAALAQAQKLVADGADRLDLGAESTRPGFAPVDEGEERARLLPVLRAVAAALPEIPISVDTTKPAVARAALSLAPVTVNDVSGLTAPGMMDFARESRAPWVLMRPSSVPARDLVSFFARQLAALDPPGSQPVALDPGIGFGTTREEDFRLLEDGVRALLPFARPIWLGVSRKRVARVFRESLPAPASLDAASAVLALRGVAAGATHVRVHDPAAFLAVAAKEDA
ncbi:MAG: dihydropteroate synthase [Kiritimatiellae bacterium]|nr:dihydropteroate synthase [Kiritimatiellia bacterium]